MNNGLITAHIVKHPIRFSNFNYYITEIQVNFLHMKDYFANAVALAEGKIGKDIIEFYCKGDYILIEGEFLVIEDQKDSTRLVIYVTDVQPVYLIIQE